MGSGTSVRGADAALPPAERRTTHAGPRAATAARTRRPPGMSASFLPPLQLWMGPDFQLLAKAMMLPPWMVVSLSSPMYTWGRGRGEGGAGWGGVELYFNT